MKQLYTYLEELATPADTMGMGNPGMASDGRGEVLTEPIGSIDGCAHCIKQDEKSKKKKKQKIKESIFDDDLYERNPNIGDILELDRWECSISWHAWNLPKMLDFVISSSSAIKTLKQPKWIKFLRPFAKSYERGLNSVDRTSEYLDCWQLVFFTWIIMCCDGKRQIKQKLEEFIDETIDKKYSIEVIPLEGVGQMRDLVRMVLFKFKFNESEIVFYMTLKKRV